MITNGPIWALWFLAVGVPGAVLEAGLQSELNLPLGYCMAAILFVIVLAVATAEAMEHVTAKREEDAWLDGIDLSDLSYEGEKLQADIDEELNER